MELATALPSIKKLRSKIESQDRKGNFVHSRSSKEPEGLFQGGLRQARNRHDGEDHRHDEGIRGERKQGEEMI